MTSPKREFERFVAWLYLPAIYAPPHVRRLANLVLANFDGLAQTSFQHNRRSIYLVNKARQSLADTLDTAPNTQAFETKGNWPWKRLKNITIGPFRGFRRSESIDLQKRVVLLYGPNGSGKTSFCEALEFGLLGSVGDAGIKRINEQTYLTNVHARQFEVPVLLATDHQNREVTVVSDPDAFRFCFIEKNRIDAFSRIAARPSAQRTELIATLFGTEKFNEFVNQFNESLDSQLVLTTIKQSTLNAKRSAIANDQLIINDEAKALERLEAEEAALALTHSASTTYSGLKKLVGTAGVPGRLQQLEDIINALPPAVLGLSRRGLMDAFEAVHRCQEKLACTVGELEAHSKQVSFKNLYTAVLALQVTNGDCCPACGTPLMDVKSDPFDRARAGLAQLKELSELEERSKDEKIKVANASQELCQQLKILAAFISSQSKQETPVGEYLNSLLTELPEKWWATLFPASTQRGICAAHNVPTLEQLLTAADQVATRDASSALAIQERHRNIVERDELNKLRLSIQAQELKRKQLVDEIAAAKGRVAAFEAENAQLISEVAQEVREIERDRSIKIAYDDFLALLKAYRNKLADTLTAGLNDAAMNFYNEFNCNDLNEEKLSALYLPRTSDQKIEIMFRGGPAGRVDALQILSEGHIRCLGLAILLAKSQSLQSPLIVFDDVINAIDHEHRSGIRQTIFESDYFASTQLIVTCHSNEFIKDIQQHLPVKRRDDCYVYLFSKHTGDYHPFIKHNVPSKNYVVKARASLEELDHREALTFCRKGLEMLSEKVWRWLGSHGWGTLNLQLDGVGAKPSLNNLCTALNKRLENAGTFSHINKLPLLKAYGRILGIPATNLIWTYLNDGTHEKANRDDFDADQVEFVVQTLEELEALDLRANK